MGDDVVTVWRDGPLNRVNVKTLPYRLSDRHAAADVRADVFGGRGKLPKRRDF